MINAAIIGANGYTGKELIKILHSHPSVNLKYCASRKEAGTKIRDTFIEFYRLGDMKFCDTAEEEAMLKDTDVVFSALPHAASAELMLPYIKKGIKVVDLSADFRYKSLELYEKTYKVVHPCPQLLEQAVYGLPELNFDKIAAAKIVGNPGCYTTCSILPLYPLLSESVINSKGIIIDAKSGVSGAGRKAETSLLFNEVSEDFKAYGVTTHRHTSEIEEVLSLATKKETVVCFTPHLLPVKRGILSTIYAPLNKNITENDISDIYSKYYAGAPFVSVYTDGSLPQLKSVAYTNDCHIGFKLDKKNNQIIIISCLDNILKGASGQAVQNMNIMFGLNQTAGLLFGNI